MDVTDRWVAAIEDSPKPPPCRVTLTYPIINNALSAAFAFAGAGKAELVKVYTSNKLIGSRSLFIFVFTLKLICTLILQRLLKDKEDLPANRVKPLELLWILDKSAASQL